MELKKSNRLQRSEGETSKDRKNRNYEVRRQIIIIMLLITIHLS